MRAGKSHRATETELEPQSDECLRLLKAPIESMRNAARELRPAQGREHGILRPTHMQNDRQFIAAGEFELRAQKPFLPRDIDIRHETIQADFPHGDGATLRKQGVERVEIAFIGPVDVKRMNAQRRKNPWRRLRQMQHPVEARMIDGGYDEPVHPDAPRPFEHRRPISVEFGGVEMEMGIDQQLSSPAPDAGAQ